MILTIHINSHHITKVMYLHTATTKHRIHSTITSSQASVHLTFLARSTNILLESQDSGISNKFTVQNIFASPQLLRPSIWSKMDRFAVGYDCSHKSKKIIVTTFHFSVYWNILYKITEHISLVIWWKVWYKWHTLDSYIKQP